MAQVSQIWPVDRREAQFVQEQATVHAVLDPNPLAQVERKPGAQRRRGRGEQTAELEICEALNIERAKVDGLHFVAVAPGSGTHPIYALGRPEERAVGIRVRNERVEVIVVAPVPVGPIRTLADIEWLAGSVACALAVRLEALAEDDVGLHCCHQAQNSKG